MVKAQISTHDSRQAFEDFCVGAFHPLRPPSLPLSSLPMSLNLSNAHRLDVVTVCMSMYIAAAVCMCFTSEQITETHFCILKTFLADGGKLEANCVIG